MKRITITIAMTAAFAANAASDGDSCGALRELKMQHRQILAVNLISAGSFQAPDGKTYEVPAFCRIEAVARPTSDSDIRFEVWLPARQQWNGRYYQHGQGGGGGAINYRALSDGIRGGAASAATDDGRKSGLSSGKAVNDIYKARWEDADHPERVIDNAYRALGETTTSAKHLIRAYYGKAPRYSYFAGCSGGGGYAWKAVERFPQEWDGVLIGAPSNNASRYYFANVWNSRRWLDPKSRILPAKLPAIQRAALASCTPQAHVIEGIATDPRFCPFDPTVLSCKGEETNNCLTPPQIETLKMIYSGPRNPRTGEQLYPGFPASVESAWSPFLSATPGEGFLQGVPFNLYSASLFVQYVFRDERREERIKAFDFDEDVVLSERKLIGKESLKSVMNATNPDLSPLHKRGGKILLYFGWADSALTPLESIAHYENVVRTMGGLEKTRDFFRLFMVPGMGHCGNTGPGANAFGQWFAPSLRNDAEHNIQRALEAWVETGRKPDHIIAAKYLDDKPENGVAFTRPLCPYPEVAQYSGAGDINNAASFRCQSGEPKSELRRKGASIRRQLKALGPEVNDAPYHPGRAVH